MYDAINDKKILILNFIKPPQYYPVKIILYLLNKKQIDTTTRNPKKTICNMKKKLAYIVNTYTCI